MGVVLALTAALLWGSTPVADAKATRAIGARSVWAWSMLLGITLSLPLAFIVAGVPHPSLATVAWLVATGVSVVVGMGLFFRAIQLGPVPLVAGIMAADGTCAAVYALIGGERIAVATLAGIGVVVAGMAIVLAPGRIAAPGGTAKAAALAGGATIIFGFSLYGGAHVVHGLPPVWIAPSTRLIGVLFVTLPMASRGALVLPRAVSSLVAYSTFAQITGFLAYLYATRSIGIAVPAVLASQAAIVGIVMAFLLLDERLSRRRLVGMAVVLCGVALVSSTRA